MYLTSSSFSDSTTASPDSYQDPFPEDLESFWFDNSKPLCKTSTVKPPPPVPRPSRRKNSAGNRSSNNTSRSDRVLNSVCGRRSMNGSSNTSNVSTYSDEDSTADGSVDQFTNPKKRSNPFGEDTKDEARKARNRASAERSRQRRLMYTSSLEEKLSDVERKNKMLEMEKDNLENMIKAIASGQIQADQALALMKSSKDAQAIINTAANTETLLDDYLQIQPSHSIGAVNPHSNDFFAAQNNNSKQNQTHGGDMVNNDIDFHTIAQVISGSERSTLYNILLSWLSGNLMLIVLQMGLYLTMNQNMMIALKQIKNLKISSAPLMEKISMDGILRLVNEKVHKELTLNQVNGLVKNFVVNNMDDYQLRFLCNHKIK